MNPLRWKREHQVALICAIILGAFCGFTFGIWSTDPYQTMNLVIIPDSYPSGSMVHDWCCKIHSRLLFGPLWGLFGAGLAAALVYIRQLLRA
jgi:hypothetical protein